MRIIYIIFFSSDQEGSIRGLFCAWTRASVEVGARCTSAGREWHQRVSQRRFWHKTGRSAADRWPLKDCSTTNGSIGCGAGMSYHCQPVSRAARHATVTNWTDLQGTTTTSGPQSCPRSLSRYSGSSTPSVTPYVDGNPVLEETETAEPSVSSVLYRQHIRF